MLIFLIGGAFTWIVKFITKDTISDYSLRKIFHIQIYLMFSIGIYYTPILMKLFFSFLIWFFWVMELIRQKYS